MDIWILNNKTGLNLFYKSFSRINVESDLISGLLSAFNQFTMAEFKQPIESIQIGGLRWIYVVEPELDLLFVAADSKEIAAKELKDRLITIKDTFIKNYEDVWQEKRKFWDGDLSCFNTFHEMLENIYYQWEEAEIVNTLADFFDFLGVFQQLFNLIQNGIIKLSNEQMKEKIQASIAESFEKIKGLDEFIHHNEIKKMTYSKRNGFKILNVNPANCDPVLTRRLLVLVIEELALKFKEIMNIDSCIKFFRDNKVFDYILNNNVLFRELNLEKYFLKLFLFL